MLCRFVISLSLVGLAWAGPANAARVRVRGTVSIDGRAVALETGVEIRGRLEDDAGRPVAATHIRLRLLSGPRGQELRLPAPEACPPTVVEQLHTGRGDPIAPDEYIVDTDAEGSFCLLAPGVGAGVVAELSFEGSDYYPPASATIDVVPGRRVTLLAFSPEPNRLPLERPAHTVWVEARVEPPLAADEARESLQLELSFTGQGEQTRVVTQAQVRPGERAELEIPSTLLGAPGPGVLSVRYAGSETLQPVERSAVVLRTARVVLGASGTIPTSDPAKGVEIPVAVGSALGAVPSGSVEALLFDGSVGMAAVRAGAATVLARFEPPRDKQVELVLVYVPREPWWTPGDSLVVRVPLAPPSAWRSLPWVVAAVTVLLWFVGAWRRPMRTERRRPDDESAPPSGQPSLEVVERGPANSGWRGRVVDAHDAFPIEQARVQVLVPAFAGDGVVSEAATDENGSFQLAHVDEAAVQGARLRISAKWHAALVRPIPPAGFVAIQLVSRRRALLERLVEWARRRGGVWTDRAEPTPGEIASRARQRREPAVATWADAVQEGAYGPDPLDEPRESAIRDREPPFGEPNVKG